MCSPSQGFYGENNLDDEMTQYTDTEILEFLLSNFQMHSPKMNGQHSWRFMYGYPMTKAVGPSARDAVIACMKEVKKND